MTKNIKKTTKASPEEIPHTNGDSPEAKQQEKPVLIVGMGGSAGALQAYEKFFSKMPPDSGAAFVIVQHLDPNHKGLLPELLQDCTKMKVLEVEGGVKVAPDHVYIIPPNREMVILGGRLLLTEPVIPRSMNTPIDHFFASLADDQGEAAAGIIFSGMGADGELGIRLLKENFGLALVQDPVTAVYDGMPRRAIQSNLVDYIGAAEEMPPQILNYIEKLSRNPADVTPSERDMAALQQIFILVHSHTGHDFSQYKLSTIIRRIERRVIFHQIPDISEYLNYLRENIQEIDFLLKEFLISVTKFFRDAEAFEALALQFKKIISHKSDGDMLRIWAAGCATGEEAYSLAIIVTECLEKMEHHPNITVQIFATDLDSAAIDQARMGFYYENISGDLSAERLERFFVKKEDGYQVKREIREMMVFAVHNLIKDAPFTRLDMLCCRNLLIYFTTALQKKIIPVFHYALNPGGLLFLGSSENASTFSDIFSSVNSKWKIFRANESTVSLSGLANFPISPVKYDTDIKRDPLYVTGMKKKLFQLFHNYLLEHFAPAAVLVNSKGDILLISGRTGKYLELHSGEAEMNILKMAREGLKYEISTALHRAVIQQEKIYLPNVRVKHESGAEIINLTLDYIREPLALQGLVMVVFEHIGTVHENQPKQAQKAEKGSEIVVLEKELEYTKQQLQSSLEQMETSLEELKSANEELQSTNEELQSTNEEAITSREEMQSVNEELVTSNIQLQNKTEELQQANNDMKNLLDSTDIATIFLDNELRIMRFTPQATKITKLIQTDLGRSISDLAFNLNYEKLLDDIQEVLDTLRHKEVQVQTKTGEWYSMRIMAYRTLENYISGAVITFSEITAIKATEAVLKKNEVLLNEAQNMAKLGSWEWEPETNKLNFSDELYRILSVNPELISPIAKDMLDYIHPEDRERIAVLASEAVRQERRLSAEFRVVGPDKTVKLLRCSGKFIVDEFNGKMRMVGVAQDISEWETGRLSPVEYHSEQSIPKVRE